MSVLLFVAASTAEAVTIGPVQTKRERLAQSRGDSRDDKKEIQAQSKPLSGPVERLAEPRRSPDLYERIHESFLREDYESVLQLSDEFFQKSAPAARVEDVQYLKALSFMKLKRFEEARALLRELEAQSAGREGKARAAFSYADSFFFENENAKAAESYERALKNYSWHEEASAAKEKMSAFLFAPIPMLAPTRPLQQIALEESVSYSVQVGSFGRQRNAEALVHRLARKRYEAYMEADSGDGMYRVRVGRFSKRKEAEKLQEKLREEEGLPTRIHP